MLNAMPKTPYVVFRAITVADTMSASLTTVTPETSLLKEWVIIVKIHRTGQKQTRIYCLKYLLPQYLID